MACPATTNTPCWWSSIHSGPKAPRSAARMLSSVLCSRITARPAAPRTPGGSRTSGARTIIDSPSAHRTSSSHGSAGPYRKFSAKRRSVSSTTISQSPRVARYADSVGADPSRCNRRLAAMPASSTKAGAQTCVTHRVRNRIGVVWARSSGWKVIAPEWTKSRTWSRAMMTITEPRTASIASRRAVGTVVP